MICGQLTAVENNVSPVGVSGRTVEIFAQGSSRATYKATTGANGAYTATGITTPGTYRIKPGLNPQENAVPSERQVTLPLDGSANNQNFQIAYWAARVTINDSRFKPLSKVLLTTSDPGTGQDFPASNAATKPYSRTVRDNSTQVTISVPGGNRYWLRCWIWNPATKTYTATGKIQINSGNILDPGGTYGPLSCP